MRFNIRVEKLVIISQSLYFISIIVFYSDIVLVTDSFENLLICILGTITPRVAYITA